MSANAMIRKLARHRILLRTLDEDREAMRKAGYDLEGIDRNVRHARGKFCDELIETGRLCKKEGDRVTARLLSMEYARQRKLR
tara:strand:- start:63866 stop:64114 length:249 start_codon:yes stop_codon:yes gene_type:complete